jgi:hypothetical protein
MHSTGLISNEELQNAIEKDYTNSDLKSAGQLLLDTINDWPTYNLTNPSDFLIDIQREVGSPLSLENIIEYSKTLNLKSDAWKLEAMASVIEIFNYDKAKSLDKIVNEISVYYKKDT